MASQPPATIGSSFTLQPIARGVTDGAGSVVASLDGAALAGTSLGDIGTGRADAFNVMALALAPGQQAVWHGVAALGQTVSATVRAAAVDPTLTSAALQGETIEPLSVTVVDEGYRYIRVLAYNCAKGMNCDLWYRYSSGTTRQTQAEIAIRYQGTTIWSAGHTNPDHQVVLRSDNSPWTRDTGQLKKYGFTLSFAGFLSLQDLATYGSITSMTYAYASGCSGKRLLWGDGTDPVAAPIVQASCV